MDRSTELLNANWSTPSWCTLKPVRASFLDTFRNAISGIAYVLRTQRNARIHLGITSAVLLLGIWLRLSLSEWVLLATVAGLVWSAELINTAIETAVDLASPERQELAGTAKDISAGAVLLAAMVAAIVGLLVLGPPLLDRIGL